MTMPLDEPIPLRTMALCILAVLTVSVIPLYLVDYPPLFDLPFHVARFDILLRWSESAFLQERYALNSFLLPNLGSDVVVVVLAQVLPLPLAVASFLTLIMAITVGGVVFLHYCIFGKMTLWPLMSSLLLYNFVLKFGFINYLFGIGLMLWAVGAWMLIADRPAWVRLAFGSAFSAVLYLAHLAAFGVYALVIAGWELDRAARAWRREGPAVAAGLAVAALPLFVPIAFLLLASPTVEAVDAGVEYRSLPARLQDFLRAFSFAHVTVDLALVAVLVAVAALVLRYGRLRMAPPFHVPLCMIVVVTLVIPSEMMSGGFIDMRLPPALYYLIIASTTVSLPRPRLRAVVVAAVAGLLLFRMAAFAQDWPRFQRRIDRFVEFAAALPAGSTVFVAAEGNEYDFPFMERQFGIFGDPICHFAALGSARHDLFVPSVYADVRQQSIRLLPRLELISQLQKFWPITLDTPESLVETIGQLRAANRQAFGGTARAYLYLLWPDRLLPAAAAAGSVVGGDAEAPERWSRYVLLDITDPPASGHARQARP